MSDDTTTTPAPASAPAVATDTSLRDSLRAVTAERSRLAAELKAAQEQVGKLQADLKSTSARHTQDMHLVSAGITSKRGRRAIRREYADAVAEVADGAEAPAFGDFVGELREDPLFGRWFSTAADNPVENSQQPMDNVKPTRKPASDPNAGTTTPAPPQSEVDLKGYRAHRAKSGRKAALAANLELLKKQGLIS